jgi:hypothetical protein
MNAAGPMKAKAEKAKAERANAIARPPLDRFALLNGVVRKVMGEFCPAFACREAVPAQERAAQAASPS